MKKPGGPGFFRMGKPWSDPYFPIFPLLLQVTLLQIVYVVLPSSLKLVAGIATPVAAVVVGARAVPVTGSVHALTPPLLGFPSSS